MAIVLPAPSRPPVKGAPAIQLRAYRQWKTGQSFAQRDRWADAAEAFIHACQWPQDGAYGVAAIHALIKAGQPELALEMARRSHLAHPDLTVAYTLEAHAWLSLGRHSEAVKTLALAPAHLPKDHDFWVSLAVALQKESRHHEAIQVFMQALMMRLDQPLTHYHLGTSFRELGMKAEAAECVRTALALGLEDGEMFARAQLLILERAGLEWARANQVMVELREAVAKLPEGAPVQTGAFQHAVLVDDPLEQLKVARHFAAHASQAVPQCPRVSSQRRDGRVRVGYASADFHNHATSYLMVEMLEHHDHSKFEVFLFSKGPDDGSDMRRRIKASSEHFEDVSGLSFQRMAQHIRDLDIDILIDLKGGTHNTLLPAFGARPARLQISWLGYPGTTGASYIDYVVGDRVVTPLEHAHHFSEMIAQMPHCYQPNDSKRLRPLQADRKAWGLPQEALVLCGFHQPYKISAEVFDVWCRLLHAEPRAVLWLLSWNPSVQPRLTEEAKIRGIAADRLFFVPILPLADHLHRLSCADLFLDAWPCHAHTTASEALWVGVPVLTWIGPTFAQRVAASLLEAVSLPQCVATDLINYEHKVLDLLRNSAARHQIRDHLIAQAPKSPLFDGACFAHDFEALLLRMWERYLEGLPPAHLPAIQPDFTTDARNDEGAA